MYCARHTWATVARSLQVPMNVISQAMGHNNERTTEIYIRNVDSDIVDGANAQILRTI
jgi:integrase